MTACGDEKGYPSLDAFYGGSPDGGSSSSGGGSSSGGTSANVSCGGISSTGLLAYLPLDGDARVLGTALRVTNPPPSSSFVSGRMGQASSGSKQLFLEPTKSFSLSSWTACAWVRVSSESNIGFLAVPGSPPLNSGVADSSLVSGCGSVGVAPYVTTSSGNCIVGTGAPFEVDEWNFLCVVSDSSSTRIHLDGITASESGKGSISLSIGPGLTLAVGGGPPGSNAIDEFSFWSRALTPEEMQSLATTRCSAGGGESP